VQKTEVSLPEHMKMNLVAGGPRCLDLLLFGGTAPDLVGWEGKTHSPPLDAFSISVTLSTFGASAT